METLQEKIARVVGERVEIVDDDSEWPRLFDQERRHLENSFPPGLIKRVEHVGSTSIRGLIAKPIIDMLVELASLERGRTEIAPILEAQGYDYFERPTRDDDRPPTYLWFIKRDGHGNRTHHIHMVDGSTEHAHHWDKLLFRDYLRLHPKAAEEYGRLKQGLFSEFHDDRIGYTKAKSEFIAKTVTKARQDKSRG